MKLGLNPEGKDIVRIETKVMGDGGYYHVYLYARKLPEDFFEIISVPHQGYEACAGDIVEAEYGKREGKDADVWVLKDVVQRKTRPVSFMYGGNVFVVPKAYDRVALHTMSTVGRILKGNGIVSDMAYPNVLDVAMPLNANRKVFTEMVLSVCTKCGSTQTEVYFWDDPVAEVAW